MTSSLPEGTDNLILLRGRLTAPATSRTLSDGTEQVSFSLDVLRNPDGSTRFDRIECATVLPHPRKSLARAKGGERIELEGRLVRRFWRTPAGLGQRYEVETLSLRITSRRRNGA
jgi:hypothetical protein